MSKTLSGDTTPVVYFLHGFPNNQNIWRNQVDALKGHAEMIMLQLPGAEGLDLARKSTYRVSRIVALIAAAVRQKKRNNPGKKIIFVGHDLGACILNEVSAKYPGLVDAQILINGGGIRQIGQRLFSWKQLKRSYYVGLFCLPFVPNVVRRCGKWVTRKLVYRYESSESAKSLQSDTLNNFQSIFLYRQFILSFVTGRSQKICHADTTFVASKNDPFLVLPTQSEMSRYFAKYELLTLNAGHWSPFTDFMSINQIIKNTIYKLEFVS